MRKTVEYTPMSLDVIVNYLWGKKLLFPFLIFHCSWIAQREWSFTFQITRWSWQRGLMVWFQWSISKRLNHGQIENWYPSDCVLAEARFCFSLVLAVGFPYCCPRRGLFLAEVKSVKPPSLVIENGVDVNQLRLFIAVISTKGFLRFWLLHHMFNSNCTYYREGSCFF